MIMEHVSSFFKMEKDVCYIVGEREGEKKGEKKGELNKSFEVVQKLLMVPTLPKVLAKVQSTDAGTSYGKSVLSIKCEEHANKQF